MSNLNTNRFCFCFYHFICMLSYNRNVLCATSYSKMLCLEKPSWNSFPFSVKFILIQLIRIFIRISYYAPYNNIHIIQRMSLSAMRLLPNATYCLCLIKMRSTIQHYLEQVINSFFFLYLFHSSSVLFFVFFIFHCLYCCSYCLFYEFAFCVAANHTLLPISFGPFFFKRHPNNLFIHIYVILYCYFYSRP